MLKRFIMTVCLFLGALSAYAVEVTSQQAQWAAQGWRTDPRNTLEAQFAGKVVSQTRTYRNEDGDPIFYVVVFRDGGFIVTAADDALEPIVAFSETGIWVEDAANPLWVMLNRDMDERTRSVAMQSVASTRERLSYQLDMAMGNSGVAMAERHQSRWQQLMEAGKTTRQLAYGLLLVSDVRVSPLVQSKWGQGMGIYNYYTPSNYVCGCVATAMAQLMRFHQWPTASVTSFTNLCKVNGVDSYLKMQGGTYDWSQMELVPGMSPSTAVKQAIGKLTYDCGVSVGMEYGPEGSGAATGLTAYRYEDRFGYEQARTLLCYEESLSVAEIQRSVLANLDAQKPVLLSIDGLSGGHAIVGDGYGYSGNALYVHLNLGWEGSNDAWYNLPTVSGYGYSFSTVSGVVYNVFPEESGELLTGRVTTSTHMPVAAATVTAKKNGAVVATAETDAKGIYALVVPSGGAYQVTMQSGETNQTRNVNVLTSTNTKMLETGVYYINTGSIGNSWGNDFVVDSVTLPPPSAPTGVTASYGTSTYGVIVRWSEVSGAETYDLYRATSSTGTKQRIREGVTGTTHLDMTAMPGVLYYYWVKAVGPTGSASAWSANVNAGYRKLDFPVLTASTTNTTKITLSCTPVLGAYAYRVWRSTSLAGQRTALGNWQSGTNWVDTTAIVGQNYYYSVQAATDINGVRPSEMSVVVMGVRPRNLPPISTPPSIGGMAMSSGGDAVTLTLEVLAGRTYRVQRTDSLENPEWVTLETFRPTANSVVTKSYPIPADVDSGFYRVSVE